MLLDANVAQLVEQFTRNEQVAGSNPAISSKNLLGTQPSKFFIQTEAERGLAYHLMSLLCLYRGVVFV